MQPVALVPPLFLQNVKYLPNNSLLVAVTTLVALARFTDLEGQVIGVLEGDRIYLLKAAAKVLVVNQRQQGVVGLGALVGVARLVKTCNIRCHLTFSLEPIAIAYFGRCA